MQFSVGQNFTNKFTNSNYQIYDIIGQSGAVPSETAIIYLKLTSRSGFFNNSQQFVAIPSRHLLEFFNPVVQK
jgi:hypothetical protein